MTNSQRPQPQQPDGEPVVWFVTAIRRQSGEFTVYQAYDADEREEADEDATESELEVIPVVSKADYDRMVEQRDAAQARADQAEAEGAWCIDVIRKRLESVQGVLARGRSWLTEQGFARSIGHDDWIAFQTEERVLRELVETELVARNSASAALLARLERLRAALNTLGSSVHVPEWASKVAREALESEE